MITITIQCETAEDAITYLAKMGIASQTAPVQSVDKPCTETKVNTPTPKQGKKGGKKGAAVKEEPVAEVAITKEDVQAALRELGSKFDMDAVRNVLSLVKAAKVSEIPESKFADVITKCESYGG